MEDSRQKQSSIRDLSEIIIQFSLKRFRRDFLHEFPWAEGGREGRGLWRLGREGLWFPFTDGKNNLLEGKEFRVGKRLPDGDMRRIFRGPRSLESLIPEGDLDPLGG